MSSHLEPTPSVNVERRRSGMNPCREASRLDLRRVPLAVSTLPILWNGLRISGFLLRMGNRLALP